MGEVKVLGAAGEVADHLTDVGQTLILNKIYAETDESMLINAFLRDSK